MIRPLWGPEGRRQLQERDRRWHVKFYLRVFSTVLSVLAIVCFGSAVDWYTRNPQTWPDTDWRPYLEFLVWPLIPCVWSIIWNGVNLGVNVFKHRPLNPGSNVGIDLITWLTFAGTDTLAILGTDAFIARVLEHPYRGPRTRVRIGIVLVGILFVVHFILFIFACRDAYIRDRQRREERRMIREHLAGLKLASLSPAPTRALVICDHCHDQAFPDEPQEPRQQQPQQPQQPQQQLHRQQLQPLSPGDVTPSIYDHDHELVSDSEIETYVAGAPTDEPPSYPASAREMYLAENSYGNSHGNGSSRKAGLSRMITPTSFAHASSSV
ncbi:MAG: hypothetical protein M1826_007332 [Phylliscum demangeonii]|nr:MAG: hypothetical protein M1826_007332 [Phylliscum demangeonii]